MLVAASLLGSLFFLPMWNITLEAPQYPEPIGMNIFINKFEGAHENDIKNINIMNHYVGMKEIPEVIPEFELFPLFVGGLILFGLIAAFIGNKQLYLTWTIVTVILGSIAFYDFYLWEYDYGHNLKENAAIKFTDAQGEPMAYQPPLIGNKVILNFRALSWPRAGAYLMFLGLGLSVWAFVSEKKKQSLGINSHAAAIGLMLLLISCKASPDPIQYGMDACHYCRMTIVDKQHAAELVSQKGKSFKYDAIECMMNDLNRRKDESMAFILTSDYSQPGKLIDATKANYIITTSIPSPMGAFLSAFEDPKKVNELIASSGGDAYDWTTLQQKFE